MADRKSTDNPTLLTLASGDLIDVVDVSETTDSQKNKSIEYQYLKDQLESELSIGGSPALTEQTSFNTGFTGTIQFYKLGRQVTAQIDLTVASPSNSIALTAGTLSSDVYPINTQHSIMGSLNNTTNVRVVLNATGQLDLIQNGTSSTKAPNGRYLQCITYFSLT